MDGRRFDDLTRIVASSRSRRSILRGLVGGAAALVATKAGVSVAAPPHGKVDICQFDEETGTYHLINVSTKAADAHRAHGDRFTNADCPVNFDLDMNSCECVCNETCTGNFELNSETCTCDCNLEESYCLGNNELDTGICDCVCGIEEEDCTGNFSFDEPTCECVCGIDATACTGNYVFDSPACACTCGITAASCGPCTQFNAATCTCDPAPGAACGTGGYCAAQAQGGNLVCVRQVYGHGTGTVRDDCRNACTTNTQCGTTGWACVSDSGCGGATHCHPLA